MEGPERGQSELTGTVLLALVLVVAASTVGFFLLERQSDQIDSAAPDAEFSTDFTGSKVKVSHLGGDRFAFSDLDLVLRTDDGESRFDLESATELQGDGDDSFEDGERVEVSHSVSGEATILLIDTSAGGFVLYEETKSPTGGGGGGSDNSSTIETFNVKDVSTSSGAEYEVDWRATDDQGDITSAEVELINSDSEVVEDSESYSFSETGDTGTITTTLTNSSGLDEVYEIRLTVTDAEGNTATDYEFDRAEIDTTPPVIGNFSANATKNNDIKVSFESDEELDQINVTIENDKNGKRETVLNESEFSSEKSGNYTYTATYSPDKNKKYNVTLNNATDPSGNDGAEGQYDIVDLSGGGGGGGGNNDNPGQGNSLQPRAITVGLPEPALPRLPGVPY